MVASGFNILNIGANMTRVPKAKKGGLTQNCQATLVIDGDEFEGRTGRNHGHAEMDALHEIIRHVKLGPVACSSTEAPVLAAAYIKSAKSRSVSCPSRAVCYKCRIVLTHLKFKAAGTTKWGNSDAGSTEWAASNDVRELLRHMNIDYEHVIHSKLRPLEPGTDY
jgi:hypothetical protein